MNISVPQGTLTWQQIFVASGAAGWANVGLCPGYFLALADESVPYRSSTGFSSS